MSSHFSKNSDTLERWGARLVLTIMAVAAAWGLWQIKVSAGGTTHVWPVHSHHLVPVVGMLFAWIILGLAALVAVAALVVLLWDSATA